MHFIVPDCHKNCFLIEKKEKDISAGGKSTPGESISYVAVIVTCLEGQNVYPE